MFSKPLWAYAFRPFFLAAPAFAILALVAWAAMLSGWLAVPSRPVGWHAHEMLFGFAGAALGGFLLTAVPSWTSSAPVTGPKLGATLFLWAAGRIAMAMADVLPGWAGAVLDLGFLPWLAFLTARPLLTAASGRHRVFVPLLAGLTLANLLVHLGWAGIGPDLDQRGLTLGLHLFALLIVVTVGRISPVVIAQALEETGDSRRFRPNPPRQNLAAAVLALYAAAELFLPDTKIAGWAALAAAAAQLDRMADWHVGRAVTRPYVTIIYAAYWWLAVGLAAVGAAHLGATLDVSSGRHAIAVGAFGSAILAVLTIAGLRHTSRALVVPAICQAAFVLAGIASATRMAASLAPGPAHVAAALILALALALYLLRFHRMLASPRADGKEG
jgi:uncharacterized protein involved in response to NO